MNEQELLYEYKQYDGINNNKPLVKILVSYIKPSFLFKSEILTPIHLGRAVERDTSKDGVISDEDIKWLHENCIGDDDFEGNISSVNRRVGLFTGTYWAYKNYEKLGNPVFLGSFGYRKLFEPRCLESIENVDLIIPEKSKLLMPNNKTQFISWHSNSLYKAMVKNLSLVYPMENETFDSYLKSDYAYSHELYIMKQFLFNRFCEWIFPLMHNILLDKECRFIEDNEDRISMQKISGQVKDKRDIAFLMEVYTGYFLYKQVNYANVIYRTAKVVELGNENNYKQKLLSCIRIKLNSKKG